MESADVVLYTNLTANLEDYIDLVESRYETLLGYAKSELNSRSDLIGQIERIKPTIDKEILGAKEIIRTIKYSSLHYGPSCTMEILQYLENKVATELKETIPPTADKLDTEQQDSLVDSDKLLLVKAPTKLFNQKSIRELINYGDLLSKKTMEFHNLADKMPASRKYAVCDSYNDLQNLLNEDRKMIDEFLTVKNRIEFYFTYGQGRDGGSIKMLENMIKTIRTLPLLDAKK
jgi:hypothetical protein